MVSYLELVACCSRPKPSNTRSSQGLIGKRNERIMGERNEGTDFIDLVLLCVYSPLIGAIYTRPQAFHQIRIPLQLLHIRRIFPDTRGSFAIWSHHLSRVAPVHRRSTGSTACRLLTDRVVPNEQRLPGWRGRRNPPLAKPAKPIRWAANFHPPR